MPEVPTINLHPQITQIEIKTNLCNPRNLRMKVISLIRIHSYILFSLISSFTLLFRHAHVSGTKTARVALENAASIAGMFLTTECVIVEKKEDKPEMPMGAPGMGGMGGMM